ncbi:GtrA family protein [Pseudorhodoplanes sp.]|uniref:GtrA family protein n=1 Tax=Pseudorhodoplanes sp. TaxID=1934341 RepID=UPI002C491A84|nr:GtrA family protein [Pseudorhodoplanes sp.]HWV44260.1 GtrA family protein [Pseudorhodoplanes sp.]
MRDRTDHQDLPKSLPARIVAALRRQALMLKAMSFASVGAVNTLVDLGIFLLALRYLTSSLVVANVLAWTVAVGGSYVMNTFITFAAESGRRMTLRAYLTFVASQVLGLIAATTTLVLAAMILPVLYAKLLGIIASFIVNFSISHLVVFRKAGDRD